MDESTPEAASEVDTSENRPSTLTSTINFNPHPSSRRIVELQHKDSIDFARAFALSQSKIIDEEMQSSPGEAASKDQQPDSDGKRRRPPDSKYRAAYTPAEKRRPTSQPPATPPSTHRKEGPWGHARDHEPVARRPPVQHGLAAVVGA